MKIITVLIICSLTTIFYAQVSQQWESRYVGLGGNNDDRAFAMTVDVSGNVYVTGWSNRGANNYDYATVKYNSLGVQLWARTYNGPEGNANDIPVAIAVDASGNVYVTGYREAAASPFGWATIKYNSSGVQQWVARLDYPVPGGSVARALAIDASGNVYVTGTGMPGGPSATDYTTVKYNSSGDQLWIRYYNGLTNNNADIPYAIALDNLGNVYVTGTSEGADNNNDYATIKYSSSGVQLWAARYNGPGNSNDAADDIVVDASNNIYVTGQSTGISSGYDYATIKYNSSGTQLWAARYNGPGNNLDDANSIALDASGNVYVTGQSTSSGTGVGVNDYATVKYNSSGIQQWAARYNGPGNGADIATSIAVYNSGNIFVTGRSTGLGTNTDYAVIKYNTSGAQQWVQRYNGAGNSFDEASVVKVDASGNLYITGGSVGNGTSYDFATIKYHDQALPVEIAYFNSFVKENNVALNWGTTWELNNSGFEIERSNVTGIEAGEWKKVGFINGNGTTSEEKHYKFEDKKLAAGVYKYRLKQVDYNGNYEYHSLQGDVIVGAPKIFEVSQNYPNPSNPKTKIDFQIPIDGNISLSVYDIAGKEIAVLVDGFKTADFYSVEFDGSDLASGIYFYRIIAKGSDGYFSKTMKMVLVK